MLKSTITANELQANESKMGSQTSPPYSAISEHSSIRATPKAIREWLIVSREVFRAKTSVTPASTRELKENAPGYGIQCSKPFALYSPTTSSWRTCQASLLELSGWERFLEAWPKAGMTVGGAAYRRPKWEQAICAIVSGLWPTITSHEYRGAAKPERTRRMRQTSKRGIDLGSFLRIKYPNSTGRINPYWAEEFMNLPIGWTALRPLEKCNFRQWRRQHGDFLDRLVK